MWCSIKKLFLVALLALSGCSLPPPSGSPSRELPFAERALRYSGVALHPNVEIDGRPGLWAAASRFPADNTVTWLGHASFLLRMNGQVILLDPLFVDELHSWLANTGRRLVPQAPVVAQLDQVDAILISHGHSDHANGGTLRALAARFPETPVYAPSGLVPFLKRIGVQRIRPVEHFTPRTLGGITLTAVPVRHEHALVAFDPPREAMPSAWVIEHGGTRVYFAGDNAYGPHGRIARERLGAMTLALLPVGNSEPSEVFHMAHETPEEAARFARDLGAPVAIGHHWGTYAWGIEAPSQVRARFRATAETGFRPLIVDIGEPVPLR